MLSGLYQLPSDTNTLQDGPESRRLTHLIHCCQVVKINNRLKHGDKHFLRLLDFRCNITYNLVFHYPTIKSELHEKVAFWRQKVNLVDLSDAQDNLQCLEVFSLWASTQDGTHITNTHTHKSKILSMYITDATDVLCVVSLCCYVAFVWTVHLYWNVELNKKKAPLFLQGAFERLRK